RSRSRRRSSPSGSIDYPINPLSIALGAEASFVARSIAIDVQHLTSTLERAARHKGTSFVEVYQNCNVFNDGAFDGFADKSVRPDRTITLEHGKPLIFGKDNDKGIRLNGTRPEVVNLGAGVSERDLLIHDVTDPDPIVAHILSRMQWPDFPVPLGVVRAVDRPTYDSLLDGQVQDAIKSSGEGDLTAILNAGDIWEVE
ncbi:MAG: 2-oxoacid:ferredoxin oxidoreductase subunit beta, partial [Dehalococcoidia bacterium]